LINVLIVLGLLKQGLINLKYQRVLFCNKINDILQIPVIIY